MESSLDLNNVTAYLDGEELNFYVDEDAGPGNSPWVLFEVDHFSTWTVMFTTDADDGGTPTVGGPNPVQDTDGDGMYEDVTGDGAFTLSDVSALFENRNSDALQQNVELFDFDGDGAVTLADVQALFREL